MSKQCIHPSWLIYFVCANHKDAVRKRAIAPVSLVWLIKARPRCDFRSLDGQIQSQRRAESPWPAAES